MSTQQQTIAIVDDDCGVRRALARLLSQAGFRTQLFESAADFLNALPTSEAACVLIDIHLGHTSGMDLARQLSTAAPELPVVFMSGSDEETTRSQCMKLDCVAYLQKPISDERLIDAVETANRASRRTE